MNTPVVRNEHVTNSSMVAILEWLLQHKNAPVQTIERYLNRTVKGGSCGGCGRGCASASSWKDTQCDKFKWYILLSTPKKSVGVCIIRRGYAARVHSHRPKEAYYVLQGRALMRTGDRVRALRAGERVQIPSGKKHALTALSPVVILLFSFDVPFDQVHYTMFPSFLDP